MNTYEAYALWMALKLHFTSDYDAIKYNFKTRASPAALEKRKDKYWFSKLAKQRKPQDYIIHNLLEDSNRWIGSYFSGEIERGYLQRQKILSALLYHVPDECQKLRVPFDYNFKVEEGRHPPLLQSYLAKEISLETICVLNDILGFGSYWERKMADDPVAEEINMLIKKYTPFLPRYDKDEMRRKIRELYA